MEQRVKPVIDALFEGFNSRDLDSVLAMCARDVEFLPLIAKLANEGHPYRGHDGLRRYFEDVELAWSLLRITAHQCQTAPGGEILVLGRIYAQGKVGELLDLPVVWVWRIDGDRFAYGQVFKTPHEAARAVGLQSNLAVDG